MPSASVTKFQPYTRRRRSPIIDEIRHARTQLHLQSQYPGRPPFTEALPKSEWSPYPSAFDEEE